MVEERADLAQLEPVEDADVVEGGHGQHRHPLLLPQHAAGSTAQAAQEPDPPRSAQGQPLHATPNVAPASPAAVTHVAQQGQQEEEGGSNVCPAHDPGHGLCVDGVGGEQEPGQQAPRALPQEQAGQPGEERRHGPVQTHVDQVVSPGLQPPKGMVEAEGEGAERAVGLVAAAVGEQGAPEVVVEDVDPRGVGEKVLVGFDCAAAGRRREQEGEGLD